VASRLKKVAPLEQDSALITAAAISVASFQRKNSLGKHDVKASPKSQVETREAKSWRK